METKMEIKKVGVLGCGLMGSGIAQTAASAGFDTVVREVSDELINKGFAGIDKSLARFAEKGTITGEQRDEIRGRLSGTTSFMIGTGLKKCMPMKRRCLSEEVAVIISVIEIEEVFEAKIVSGLQIASS